MWFPEPQKAFLETPVLFRGPFCHQSAFPSGLCFIQFTSIGGQLKDTRSSKSRDLICQQM